MSTIDIIILVAAASVVVGVTVWSIYRRRRGKGGCGGCGSCPYAGSCEKKPKSN